MFSSLAEMEAHDRSLIAEKDDLCDGQIQQLLKDARQRLRSSNAQQSVENPVSRGQEEAILDDTSPHRPPTLELGSLPLPYISSKGGMAKVDAHRLIGNRDKELANTSKRLQDPVLVRRMLEQNKKATAGSDWFNLPRTELTPELTRDLQLLRMRSILDPKRNYKKDNRTKAPMFSQTGTIIEGPTEYYSARLSNNERKKTFVEEVLASEKSSGHFKAKYNDLQAEKTSGKKAYHEQLKSARSASRRMT